MTKEQVGRLLKETRREKGLSQEALARMLNVDRSQISRWENGKADIPNDISVQLKLNIGLNLEDELSDNTSVRLSDNEKETNETSRNVDIRILAFAMIQFLGYVIGPWGFIVCLFGLYYAFQKKLPIWVKILAVILIINLFSDFLFFYFPEIYPTEVKVEDISYVLQQGVLN